MVVYVHGVGVVVSADNKRILGIDPGTRLCGWGIVDCSGGRIHHVDNGVIVLTKHGELHERLGHLLGQLDEIIKRYAPKAVAVEGIFQHRNARSALILGHARGVALAAASSHGLAVYEYAARQVKKALTGTGTAHKEQVQMMVGMRMGLSDTPQEDAADAIAVAVCHAQHLSNGVKGPSIPNMPRRKGRKASQAALAALALEQKRSRP